jgi:hypothetical protein
MENIAANVTSCTQTGIRAEWTVRLERGGAGERLPHSRDSSQSSGTAGRPKPPNHQFEHQACQRNSKLEGFFRPHLQRSCNTVAQGGNTMRGCNARRPSLSRYCPIASAWPFFTNVGRTASLIPLVRTSVTRPSQQSHAPRLIELFDRVRADLMRLPSTMVVK